jgi:hypothetical protein
MRTTAFIVDLSVGRPPVRHERVGLAQRTAQGDVAAVADHLLEGEVGRGTLVVVPTGGGTTLDLVKGLLLRSAWGDGVDFEACDYAAVQLLLVPDGEVIDAPGEGGARVKRRSARGGGGGRGGGEGGPYDARSS